MYSRRCKCFTPLRAQREYVETIEYPDTFNESGSGLNLFVQARASVIFLGYTDGRSVPRDLASKLRRKQLKRGPGQHVG